MNVIAKKFSAIKQLVIWLLMQVFPMSGLSTMVYDDKFLEVYPQPQRLRYV